MPPHRFLSPSTERVSLCVIHSGLTEGDHRHPGPVALEHGVNHARKYSVSEPFGCCDFLREPIYVFYVR